LLQTRYENDLELSGRTIYGRVGRKKEMRSCLSNLDPLQNTPTLAKLHPKMITASTSRASVFRVRAAKKTLAHDHRHLSSNSAKIFAIPLYVYKKYRCASSLADTRTSRFTIAPSDKTNDHRPVIADHNFHFFFFGGPPRHIWPDSARLPGNSARGLFRGSP
jgi:hypothetical protein